MKTEKQSDSRQESLNEGYCECKGSEQWCLSGEMEKFSERVFPELRVSLFFSLIPPSVHAA